MRRNMKRGPDLVQGPVLSGEVLQKLCLRFPQERPCLRRSVAPRFDMDIQRF